MDIVEATGFIGALTILVFFFLNQTHRIDRNSKLYDAGNVIGSSLLVLYALFIGSTPFVVLNVVWILVSLRDIVKN